MNCTTENLFELLQKSKWDQLLSLENKYRQNIIDDTMMKQVFDKYFIDAVINYVKNEKDKLYCSLVLKKVYFKFLHLRNSIYAIPNAKFEELVISYLSVLQLLGEDKIAYLIASKWTHLNYSKELIIEYENTHSKELKHSSDETMKVSINPNIQKENHTIELFKSKQEYEFFYAVRENYPNYYTYPNVAVSCIIDFDKIKNKLSSTERDYFFKAIVDSVVYEQANDNFIPKFYFELDSIYHDEKKQIAKDKIKDKFFSLAGQKLFRIRDKMNNNLMRSDFKKMINEVIK